MASSLNFSSTRDNRTRICSARGISLLIGVFATVVCSVAPAQTEHSDASSDAATDLEHGFESIFDGKTLDGWQGPVDGYEVINGSIRCKKHAGGTIFTADQYSDFIVRLEFKLPPGGNNGLAIRYPGSGDAAYVGMCELQVLDNDHEKFNGTNKLDDRQYHGSAYAMVAAKRGFLKPTGEWNRQEVTVKGSAIKVLLNGAVILDCDLAKVNDFMYSAEKHPGRTRTKGHFGLAGHHDPVEFRNLRIKKLHP